MAGLLGGSGQLRINVGIIGELSGVRKEAMTSSASLHLKSKEASLLDTNKLEVIRSTC